MAMSPRAAAVRFLRTVHTALARWFAQPPVARKGKCSWFDCNPGTLELPRDPDEDEAEAWYRAHFRINGQPLR
jgi:hypothetical protein